MSAANADGGKGAVAPAATESNSALAMAGTGGASTGSRGERDLGGGGSVAQCFEQVPAMFFDKAFSLQVRACLGVGRGRDGEED